MAWYNEATLGAICVSTVKAGFKVWIPGHGDGDSEMIVMAVPK